MTVHGAKGLEADIVFLVDNGSTPVHPSHDAKVIALDDDRDGAVRAAGLDAPARRRCRSR